MSVGGWRCVHSSVSYSPVRPPRCCVREQELQLVGNPVYEMARAECNPSDRGSPYRVEVLRRVPKLKKLDGIPVEAEEREAAAV